MREHGVYKLCRYRRRREPHCFLPDPISFTRPQPFPLPRFIEHEQVVQLLRYVSALLPTARAPLRPPALRLAIVLLYTAGLRRGELVRFTVGDVEARCGVLCIRDSKFHKSRWVPLSRQRRGRNCIATSTHGGAPGSIPAQSAADLQRSESRIPEGDLLRPSRSRLRRSTFATITAGVPASSTSVTVRRFGATALV